MCLPGLQEDLSCPPSGAFLQNPWALAVVSGVGLVVFPKHLFISYFFFLRKQSEGLLSNCTFSRGEWADAGGCCPESHCHRSLLSGISACRESLSLPTHPSSLNSEVAFLVKQPWPLSEELFTRGIFCCRGAGHKSQPEQRSRERLGAEGSASVCPPYLMSTAWCPHVGQQWHRTSSSPGQGGGVGTAWI